MLARAFSVRPILHQCLGAKAVLAMLATRFPHPQHAPVVKWALTRHRGEQNLAQTAQQIPPRRDLALSVQPVCVILGTLEAALALPVRQGPISLRSDLLPAQLVRVRAAL
jgi:hypothetical protein